MQLATKATMTEFGQTWSFKLVLQCPRLRLCFNGSGGRRGFWAWVGRMLILSAASFPCDPQNGPDTIFLRFFHPDCRIQLPPSRLICGVRMPASQELPEVSEDIWLYHYRECLRQHHPSGLLAPMRSLSIEILTGLSTRSSLSANALQK